MVKLIEHLGMRGSPAIIPYAVRDDLPQLFVDLGFKTGVEVGCYEGAYTEVLCKAGLKMYTIDPWLDYPGYYTSRGQKRLDQFYERTKAKLSKYDCTIIRKKSMEALEDFPDGSLDFVYIDGHHGFKYVAEDLFEWTKKVKKNGIISGHDYLIMKQAVYAPYACHVKYVIDAFVLAFNIKNWYVLGNRFVKPGEVRDKARSWFWFNPYGD
jgi:hypothetical protein